MEVQSVMSLRRRLQLQVVLVAIIFVALGVMSLVQERQTLIHDRQDKVRNLVESAVTSIKWYEDAAASGRMPEADAKRQAAELLNGLRYDEREYFFAFDTDWNWMAHGAKPAMVGKNLAAVKDPTGTPLKPRFEGALSAGGGKGLVSYVWDKPGFDQPQPKVSYLATTARWGWVVGTGIYLDDVEAAFFRQALLVGAKIVAGLLLVIGVGYLIRRSVMQQLGAEPAVTLAVVRKIAEGDLHVQVPVAAGDSNSLLAAVADMQSHLRDLVSGIASSSGALADMSSEIASSASAVASSSEQQSQSATGMAASIEQLTASIKQIADLAEHARVISANSGQLSNDGGEVIAEAVVEMQRINAAVDQAATTISDLADKTLTISTIMQVIKDIADQTNLLALNAAIEAARAGEAGRGFAVVADEVRKLSERTAQATQEIAGMINDIQSGSQTSRNNMAEAVGRAKAGLALAERGGESIRQIRDSANGVVGVVNDISQALSEQGHASEEITRSVEQIALAASNNAEASGQASRAIGDLNSLSEQLKVMVKRFQV